VVLDYSNLAAPLDKTMMDKFIKFFNKPTKQKKFIIELNLSRINGDYPRINMINMQP